MNRNVIVCGSLIVLMNVSGCSQQPPPVAQASDLTTARQTVVAWLNAMNGKTVEQITGELGDASEKGEWLFRGKAERLLRYKTEQPKSTLELYFLGNRVIKASLQLLSD